MQYTPPVPTYYTTFCFATTPSAVVADCSLLSPAVLVPAYEPPAFAWSGESTYGNTLVSTAAPMEEALPAPATEAELRSTTARELADTYMKLGDLDSAIRVYSVHVTRHPGDVEAVRSLGLALVERGDVREGVDLVERAYRIDPTLARALYDRELLRTPENFALVLDRVTALAGQSESCAAGWLAVAVLMQADGREEPARAALERAKEDGLAPRIVDEFRAAVPVS